MFQWLRRKKKVEEKPKTKELSKPSLEQAMSLLWQIGNRAISPYILKPEEIDCAKFLERLGLIEILSDADAVTHKERLIAVCRCSFNCDECGNFEGYSVHSWQDLRGDVERYANPLPKCKAFGFLNGTLGRGKRCGKFVPKNLVEALGNGS